MILIYGLEMEPLKGPVTEGFMALEASAAGLGQMLAQHIGRRRHILGLRQSFTGTTDPILRPPEFTGCRVSATHAGHEMLMQLPHQGIIWSIRLTDSLTRWRMRVSMYGATLNGSGCETATPRRNVSMRCVWPSVDLAPANPIPC